MASFTALGFVRAALLAAGLAALVAITASWLMSVAIGSPHSPWMTGVRIIALQIAATFLAAALGASSFMPSRTDATRVDRGASVIASPILSVLLVALAVAAMYQVPALRTWWTEDRALLTQAMGEGPDPMGLRMIPAVLLLSLPALAGVALITFVLTSIVGMFGRSELAAAVLSACVSLQAGLVIGEHVLLRAVRLLGATVMDQIAQAPDAKAMAQVSDWVARHDAAGMDAAWRLVWILGGYVLAVVASTLVSPRRTRTPAITPAEAPSLPDIAALPAIRSSTATVFEAQVYSVQPRQNFLELFLRHYSTYDIKSIPPTSQSRFSFCWKTSALSREPNGPDVLTVKPANRSGVFAGRAYNVADAATAVVLGTLKPAGSDWEIDDASGRTVARVIEEKSGVGFISYVARMNGDPVCRFRWAMQGLTVASAALDVEFLTNADAGLDRALAMALAPILEHKARRASEWRR